MWINITSCWLYVRICHIQKSSWINQHHSADHHHTSPPTRNKVQFLSRFPQKKKSTEKVVDSSNHGGPGARCPVPSNVPKRCQLKPKRDGELTPVKRNHLAPMVNKDELSYSCIIAAIMCRIFISMSISLRIIGTHSMDGVWSCIEGVYRSFK